MINDYNMNEAEICHQGVVKEIKENTLFVEIERHTACSACHAKGVCSAFDKRNEVIPVYTNEPEQFQVNEMVQLTLKKSLGGKAVVLGYLCPFLVLIISLFTTYYFSKNELLSIGVAFAATAFYYLFIKKIDNKLKKHFTFIVSKINE
jgi:sigma-E factor negative regulatory protein RseC